MRICHAKHTCEISLAVFFFAALAFAQAAHPGNGHEHFVSLSIFPFEKRSGGSPEIDLRAKMIQALGKSAAIDYLIHSPEGDDPDTLYAGAFIRRKDRTYWPQAEYWRKSPAQYLVFGNYSADRNEIAADLFLYDTKAERIIFNGKYRASVSRSSELGAAMSRSIEASLTEIPVNKGRIKGKGAKK